MREHGNSIVLIGFSAAGKSVVGWELAARLDWPRYDTDEMVSAQTGLTISEIFEQRGEAVFRELESDALRRIPAEAAVIIGGGGIILREENARLLKQRGRVIYLRADEETLVRRLQTDVARPLLRTANPRQTISELLQTRAPLYEGLADIVIDTTSLTPSQVADKILQELAEG